MSSQVMGQGRGALSRAAGLVAEARHDLDRLTSELVAHIDATRSHWSGQGGSAFTTLGHAWTERQRAIVGALDGLEVALRATEQDNVTTDETQATGFGRTQLELG
jgi:uncharacterized protein YukE